jgi:hypothetical protein
MNAVEAAVQDGMAVIDWTAYPDPPGGGEPAADAAEIAVRAALGALRIDVDVAALGDVPIGTVLRVLRAAGLRPQLGVEMSDDDVRPAAEQP